MKKIFRNIDNFLDDLEDSFENIIDKIDDMISINGKTFEGRNITVKNNKVIIDGVDVTPDSNSKHIDIIVDGNVDKLDIDMCDKLMIKGNVNTLAATSVDVQCGDVTGNVHTVSGDIECGNVGGSVTTTSGDVKCENVTGGVKTLSGDIKHRK
jgi:hypothetical protein